MTLVSAIPGFVTASPVVAVLSVLESMGHDPDRLLAEAGIVRSTLKAGDARLPVSQEFAFWNAIARAAPDPMIGIHIGERVGTGALGGFEYLLRNSDTLRSAVKRANHFGPLVDDLAAIQLIEEDDSTVLRLDRRGGHPQPPRGVEALFCAMTRVGREVLGEHSPLEVRFAHAAPADPKHFAAWFGCPVAFDRPHYEFLLRAGIADLPVQGADARLSAVLETHLSERLLSLPQIDPLILRVRGELAQSLQRGGTSLDALAHVLGTSSRSLRRHLNEHGTSYSALLDEVRRDSAERLLSTADLPFPEVAERLGFSEPSTFYRACKRWFGKTPAAFRQTRKP